MRAVIRASWFLKRGVDSMGYVSSSERSVAAKIASVTAKAWQ